MFLDAMLAFDIPIALRIFLTCVMLLGGSYVVTKIILLENWHVLVRPFIFFGLMSILIIPVFFVGFPIFWTIN